MPTTAVNRVDRRPSASAGTAPSRKAETSPTPEGAGQRHHGLTRTTSFWWGHGASHATPPFDTAAHAAARWRAAVADVASAVAATVGFVSAAVFLEVSVGGSGAADALGLQPHALAAALFDVFIPMLSGLALVVMALQVVRAALRRVKPRGAPDFGRKGLLVCASGFLFVVSCFFRSVNVADEGAALCRGAPTAFNSPAVGRAVATVGEVALVVQVSMYIEWTAERLGATRGLWASLLHAYTSTPFTTVGPVLVAEAMSWSGVLSGNPAFFCAEYVLWMVVAFTWAWDGAELLHRSKGIRDTAANGGLMVGAVFLFLFNATVEIPHFFAFQRAASDSNTGTPIAGIWECLQDSASPLWVKRLPFFFCYFVGAAWSAVALAYRFDRACRVARPSDRRTTDGRST